MSELKKQPDLPGTGSSKPAGRHVSRREYVHDGLVLNEFLVRLVTAFEADSMQLEDLLEDLRSMENRLANGS